MQPDARRAANTRAWLVRALDDLGTAADLSSLPMPRLRSVLFHCQQAVEKALKAFLTWHDRPFGKTHDLRELGRECAEVDPRLESSLRAAAVLTEYAWKYRYPGRPEEPSQSEASEALRIAKEVAQAVLSRVPAAARP
jgi:HEPN domain-containing protein